MTGLNPFQQNTADAARVALDDQAHGYEPADLAARAGRLEWHLAEVLALVDELADAGAGGPADARRGPAGDGPS